MQARSEEAARQTAVEATLQWMKNVYNLRLVVIEWAVESLKLFKNEDRERRQQQWADHEVEIEGVNRGEYTGDFNHVEIPQGINRELMPHNLGPTWQMPVHAREEFVERDSRIENSSDYKINVDILGLYGEMHV